MHLASHPCIDHSIHHLSKHPSISCSTRPAIHQPTKSNQVIHWTHWENKNSTWSTSYHCNWHTTSMLVNVVKWRLRTEERRQGGSKCQVPLGSEDGDYIYQSKQPRGAEYFTCRCGLLHYHIHQSHGVPVQPLTIQNSYNQQNGDAIKC